MNLTLYQARDMYEKLGYSVRIHPEVDLVMLSDGLRAIQFTTEEFLHIAKFSRFAPGADEATGG